MRVDVDYARRLHNFRNRKRAKEKDKKAAKKILDSGKAHKQPGQEADSNANRGNARAGKRATTD